MKHGNIVNESEDCEILYGDIKRQGKKSVYITLKPSEISKLEKYGDGRLNTGIEKVLEIAESKQWNVREELIKISSQIVMEEKMSKYSSMN